MKKKYVRNAVMFRKPKHTPEQPMLLPPSIDDLVPKSHEVRKLKGLLCQLDLSDLHALYPEQGGYAYPPALMLGLLLYGRMLGETSSRKLQDCCRFDVRFRVLMEGLEPDDRTISRFQERLGRVLDTLFKQVLSALAAHGMGKGQKVAADGTKMKGNLRQRVSSQTPSDPEAKRMLTDRGYLSGYNAQAVVDMDDGVVLATDVSNCASDYSQLPRVVDKLESCVKKLVADKGYEGNENAQYLEDKGIEGYLRPRNLDPEFWTIGQDGLIRCPQGHVLEFHDSYPSRGKRVRRLFVRACSSCPQRCHTNRYKQLTHPVGTDPAARIRNAKRCASPEGEQLLAERSRTVELVFGHMKWNLGFDRFKTRGLAKVNVEFALMAMAINVGKWIATELLRRFLSGLLGCRRLLRSPCSPRGLIGVLSCRLLPPFPLLPTHNPSATTP